MYDAINLKFFVKLKVHMEYRVFQSLVFGALSILDSWGLLPPQCPLATPMDTRRQAIVA